MQRVRAPVFQQCRLCACELRPYSLRPLPPAGGFGGGERAPLCRGPRCANGCRGMGKEKVLYILCSVLLGPGRSVWPSLQSLLRQARAHVFRPPGAELQATAVCATRHALCFRLRATCRPAERWERDRGGIMGWAIDRAGVGGGDCCAMPWLLSLCAHCPLGPYSRHAPRCMGTWRGSVWMCRGVALYRPERPGHGGPRARAGPHRRGGSPRSTGVAGSRPGMEWGGGGGGTAAYAPHAPIAVPGTSFCLPLSGHGRTPRNSGVQIEEFRKHQQKIAMQVLLHKVQVLGRWVLLTGDGTGGWSTQETCRVVLIMNPGPMDMGDSENERLRRTLVSHLQGGQIQMQEHNGDGAGHFDGVLSRRGGAGELRGAIESRAPRAPSQSASAPAPM